jgi:8-oxo-dGTP pyrophosphatase MutT (NUDIX family)
VGGLGVKPRRITDPHTVPVIGTDSHLPPVAAQRLTALALRAHFRAPPPWVPELAGDGVSTRWTTPEAMVGANAMAASAAAAASARSTTTAAVAVTPPTALTPNVRATPASVLVALVQRESGLHVLLTRRTDHLRDHAGQISFPGGRAEPSDANAAATALREAAEEVGLAEQHVSLLGELPHYTTVTGFVVTPVVALVQPHFELKLDPFEVAEAFEVPLQFLMTPAHHQRHRFEWEGQQRDFFSMPWHGTGTDGVPRNYFIWGATAAMLRNLYGFLRL